MAVVRKYKTGGYAESVTSAQPLSYEDFITKKLNETKFTSKGEGLARDVADRWVRLQKAGDLDKVYSYNPVKETYNVDLEKITDPTLKAYDWSGSKDEIQKNILGKFSGRADRSNVGETEAEAKKFNTLIANWTNEYNTLQKSNSTSGVTQTGLGIDKRITPLWDYIVNENFGGNTKLAANEWGNIKDAEERKTRVISAISGNINRFLKDYSKNKGTDRFSEDELTKINNLKQAVELNNWDAIQQGAKSLGWDIDNLVSIPKDPAEEERTKAASAEERRKHAINSGTDPRLVEQGFIKINDPSNPLWRFRQSNEDIYEKDGKFYLIGVTPEGLTLSNRFITDRKSSDYGGVLISSELEGTSFLNNWEERDLNENLAALLQNIRSQPEGIIQTSPNEYINVFGGSEQLFPLIDASGKKVFGTPIKDWANRDKSEVAQNKFGHIDPTQTIFREEDGNWVQYSKGSDGKYYKNGIYDKDYNLISTQRDSQPTELNLNLGLSQWEEESFYPYYRQNVARRNLSEDFDASKLKLPVDAQIKYIRGLYENAAKKDTSTQHTRDLIVAYLQAVRKKDPVKYKQLLFQMPYDFQNFISGKSDKLDVSWMEEYQFPSWLEKLNMQTGDYTKWLSWPSFGLSQTIVRDLKNKYPIYKKGGIFKLQEGSNQSWNQYLSKYNIQPEENQVSTDPSKPNVNPTINRAFGFGPARVKQESLDKAIMVANVGSLAPGFIGMGSALGATGLELARDLSDKDKSGWETAGNLALNLGLAGAAFFGAGFLRGVKSGSKIAKSVIKATDTVSDIKKVVSTADKATDVAKITKGVATGLDDITKSLTKIEKFEKKFGSGKMSLNQVADMATNIVNTSKSKVAKTAAKKVLEDIGKVSSFTQGIAKSSTASLDSIAKVARIGTNVMVGANAVSNLPEALNTVGKIKDVIAGKENIGNISTDDVNSLVSVLFAGKIAGLSAKRSVAKKYGTIVTDKSPSKVNVTFENGKTVTLENVDKPSMRFLKKPVNRLSESDKSKLLTEYNKGLPKKDQVKELPKVKNVSGYSPETITGSRLRNEGEWDYSKNLFWQKKATQWGNRYRVGDQSTFQSKTAYGQLMDRLHGITPKVTKTQQVSDSKTKRTVKKKDTSVVTPDKIITRALTQGQLGSPRPAIPLPERFLKKGGKIKKFQNPASTLNFTGGLSLGGKPTKWLNRSFNVGTVPNLNVYDPKILPVENISSNLTNVKLGETPKDYIPIEIDPLTKPLYNPGSLGPIDSSGSTRVKGINRTSKVPDLGKINIDPVDALNALQSYMVKRGNISAAQDMKQAAASKMVAAPLMSKPYIRSTSPNAIYANRMASGMMNQGKNLARSSSNLALGTATQLSATEKASDMLTKGTLNDIQMKEKLNELRSNLGLQVDQFNLKTIGDNTRRFAESESAIHNINAGLTTANTKAVTDLIKSIGDNYKVKDMQKGRVAAVEAYNDPNFLKAKNEYERIRTDEYENFYRQYKDKMAEPGAVNVSFEDSDYGRAWKDRLNLAIKGLEPFRQKIETTQMAAQLGLPYSSIRNLNF